MLTSESSHTDKRPRPRQRPATSCTECRRRKQKCNQARDKPCNNCMRRYPPVECVYETTKRPSPFDENVINFKGGKESPVRGHTAFEHSIETPTDLPLARGENDAYFRLQIHSPSQGISNPRTPRLHLTPEQQSVAVEAFWGPSQSSRPSLKRENSFENTLALYNHRDAESSRESSPDHCNESYWGILENYVGCMSTEPLRLLPIKESRRNAELFHLFTKTLSPYMASLDGKDPPMDFHGQWIPYMVQSPLVAYVGILSAAYFQAVANRVDVEQSREVMEVRLTVVSLINKYLRTNKGPISDEAIVAVMSFSYNEWIYASESIVMAHMNGLKEMLRLRGGMDAMPLNTFKKMLIRTDYEISCAHERPHFLHEDNPNDAIPVLNHFARNLDNPLLQAKTTFVESAEVLGLSVQAATILDDMRFLTTSVLSLTTLNPQGITKFLATVNWIQQKLNSVPTPSPHTQPDFIHTSILHASRIYTAALLSQQPFSVACTAELLGQLWMNMWRVPLSRWKRIPGIFLWIVMIVLPFTRDRPEGRFIKAMASTSMMSVGLQDWDVTDVSMRTFKAVQCWLGGTRGVGVAPAVLGEMVDIVQRQLEIRGVEGDVEEV